jgi:hypothetical protein
LINEIKKNTALKKSAWNNVRGVGQSGADRRSTLMDANQKIPGDRLLIGLLSAFRTLVMELSKNGVIDQNEFVHILHQTADAHRETGDPNQLADAIDAIGLQIATSTVTPHSDTH